MITRIVKMSFEERNCEDFLKVFEGSKDKIAAFKGCKGVKLYRGLHEKNIFFTYSHWEQEEDLEAYRQSELFKTTWNKTKILFNAAPQAWSLIETGLEK